MEVSSFSISRPIPAVTPTKRNNFRDGNTERTATTKLVNDQQRDNPTDALPGKDSSAARKILEFERIIAYDDLSRQQNSYTRSALNAYRVVEPNLDEDQKNRLSKLFGVDYYI